MPYRPVASACVQAIAFALFALCRAAAAQRSAADSATEADSLAIVRALQEISADSVRRRDSAMATARAVLAEQVRFDTGSSTLSAQATELLDRKAWYLYLNPDLTIALLARADTGLDDGAARRQARARVDAVRRRLVERGVDLARIQVDERSPLATSGADAGRVEFRVTGDLEVMDVPPIAAEPPPVQRVPTAIEPSGRARWKWGTVRVFYATDRRRDGSGVAEGVYGGDESETGALEFGRLEVSVPRVHRPGLIERPVWYHLERSSDPAKHMVLRAVDTLRQPALFDSLRHVVRASGGKEALVFIHGYNVTFHDAALRTAQLVYDLRFDGAPILYSWPSKGSVFRYVADRESAKWSAAHLAVFLDSVVAVTGARHVHVIAHSMGNFVLTEALARLAAVHGRDTLFDNLVLAAPDVPLNEFQQQLGPAIRPLAQRITIYMSGRDRALWASRMLSTHLRLGEATKPMVVIKDMDTIDASAVPTDALGHGYIASSRPLIDDLVLLLGRDQPPPRGGLRSATAAGLAYWLFP